MNAGKGLALAKPITGERLGVAIGPGQTSASLRCQLSSPLLRELEAKPPPTPAAIPSEVLVRGWFRGQVLEGRIPVELYPVPDVAIYRHHLPERAGLAVRADRSLLERFGSGTGSVAFVLDCSGSMGPADGEGYGPGTKIVQALGALAKVMRALPPGTRVSLWVFGQAIGPRKRVEQAELTIQRILGPIRWDPLNPQFRTMLETATRLDATGRPRLEPWNESPVLRAMLAAKDDLRDGPGFKTMVVITDGIDNRFEKDATANPEKKPIPQVLTDRFQGTGIAVHMLGFRFEEPERAQALEQFSVVEKLDPPGKLHDVRNTAELEAALRRALSHRLLYHVDGYDNRPLDAAAAAGIEISRTGANDRWFPGNLMPGSYRTWVFANQLIRKNVLLQPGELLLLKLRDSQGGPYFERGLYSLEDHGDKPSQSRTGWRLGLLQNQAMPDDAAQMLLALEKEPTSDETILQQIHAHETWLDLTTDNDRTRNEDPRLAVRWGPRAGYPAPTFSLEVASWPTVAGGALARPRLRAWWNPLRPTPPAATWKIGVDFQTGGPAKTFTVDGQPLTLERVDVEEQILEIEPGRRESRLCLVVQWEHAPGHACLVRLVGLNTPLAEQRFYTRPGKVVTVFGPVTREAVQRDLRGLEVVPIATLKRAAEAHGFHADFAELAAPASSGIRPPPPVELK
jgi:hypothetical protein